MRPLENNWRRIYFRRTSSQLGALATKIQTGDETGRQFVYDAWNRLVTVKDSGGSALSSYQYDGVGRRISETKSGTTTDLYLSTADQVLEERVSGTATAQYVWSPVYVDALVLRDRDTDANGSLDERRWVQQDANWNVTALLDNSGAVVERYAYDPYGNFTIYDASWTSRSSSSYGWLYQHQGLRYDGGAGLYHARARDLSPSLGRWLQNDRAGFGAGDVDLYRAYGNGPTGALDPSGMFWNELKEYGLAALEGIGEGSVNVVEGGIKAAGQFGLMATDTAALVGQTIVSPFANYDYTPSSDFYKGLASTPNPAAFTARAAESVMSFGAWDIGEAIGLYIATGDAKASSQILGAVGVPNLVAAGLGALDSPGAAAGRPRAGLGQQACKTAPKIVSGGKIGIGSLTEAEIAGILQDIEAANKASGVDSHFFSKHSAATTLLEQARRARFGTLPDGSPGNPSAASRFLTHQDQLSAVLRSLEEGKLQGPTGNFSYDRIIGEGYSKGGGKSNYDVTGGVIYVYRNGRLLTIYPRLK